MVQFVFDEELKKTCYYFIDDDRSTFDGAEIGAKIAIVAKNENGDNVELAFLVTRNVYLGKSKRQHWLYGCLLETPNDWYYQIEIKLYKDEPHLDSIGVFPQAPPAQW